MSVVKDDSISVRLAEAFRLEQQSRPRRLMQLQYGNSLTRSAVAATPAAAPAPAETAPAGVREAGTDAGRRAAGAGAAAGTTAAGPLTLIEGDFAASRSERHHAGLGGLIRASEAGQGLSCRRSDSAVEGASVAIMIQPLEICGPSDALRRAETGADASSSGHAAGAPVWYQVRIMAVWPHGCIAALPHELSATGHGCMTMHMAVWLLGRHGHMAAWLEAHARIQSACLHGRMMTTWPHGCITSCCLCTRVTGGRPMHPDAAELAPQPHHAGLGVCAVRLYERLRR